ncbi:MAG: nitrogen regulation protein NR(II) [Gemmatimonadota bacterium]
MKTLTAAGRSASISAADLRNILRWVFLLRICLSTAILLTGALFSQHVFRGPSGLVLLLSLAGSIAFTVWGWVRLRSGRLDGQTFLWLQVVHDLAFITVVVLYTEGVGSAFTLLYIPLVALASVLFGTSGGALVASAASTIFILLGVYQRGFAGAAWSPRWLPRLAPPAEPFLLNVLLLVMLFFLVALLTAFLRRRLVTAGARVRELETEIRFMTVDTRDVLDSIESGVVSIDGRGELAFINREALDLLGIQLLAPDAAAVWQELRARAPALARLLVETLEFKPAISRGEVQLDSPEGRHVPLGITTNLLYDERGARRGVTAVFRDISHVKRMEELSRQRDRLAAVAELAASLAHEIKNPLASIRTSVELLASEAPAGGEEGRLYGLIVKESDRLSKLLTDFLHFSRMELREELPVALRELLEEVVELHTLRSGPARAEIRLEWIGLREPVVDGDFDLLKQLFQNLLANAVQAAAEGSGRARVTIAVSRDYAANAERYGLDASTFVETRVADNGPGIQPADLPRIFDPFFTTKPQGNGLGLAIVHRVVNVHGGAIFVESTPGKGAEFRVYLPLSGSGRPASAAAQVGSSAAV